MNAETIETLIARARSYAFAGRWKEAHILLSSNYRRIAKKRLGADIAELKLFLRYTQATAYAARGAKVQQNFGAHLTKTRSMMQQCNWLTTVYRVIQEDQERPK